MEAIKVEDLVKYYKDKIAVNKFSFHVNSGEIYGLLGKNGAGKSTTIKILTTLIGYDSGNVDVLGFDPAKNGSEIRKRIGVVQQEEAFDFSTVENNFKIYGMLWEVPKEERKTRMEELIELFDLNEIRKKRMYDLSGGQKKRVQVAREFMHDMEIFFLDEPTVGLDPIMKRKILDYVKARAKNGLTVLFTTQNLEEADYLCDRICIMNNGEKIVEGTSSELKLKYGALRTLKIYYTSQVKPDRTKITANIDPEKIVEFYISDNEINIVSDSVEEIVNDVLQNVKTSHITMDKIMIDTPTLDDVFMKVIK
ncbi:ABC transporter ATP-binding protein [Ferroplasma sp.]|uniref:ABC transporter ATP-binding protein n=1 Tax=Ferroplasma sp. TaxID=2591003 RepID=UPI00307FAE87